MNSWIFFCYLSNLGILIRQGYITIVTSYRSPCSKIFMSGTGCTSSQNRRRAVQLVWFNQSFSLFCWFLSKNCADLAIKSRQTPSSISVFNAKNISTLRTPWIVFLDFSVFFLLNLFICVYHSQHHYGLQPHVSSNHWCWLQMWQSCLEVMCFINDTCFLNLYSQLLHIKRSSLISDLLPSVFLAFMSMLSISFLADFVSIGISIRVSCPLSSVCSVDHTQKDWD